MRYTTVIFDMDGTVTDTLADMHHALNRTLKRFKLPERTPDEVRAAVGNGVKVLIAKSIPGGADHPAFDDICSEYGEYYESHCLERTKPYDGVVELLRELVRRGYKVAIVSNKPDEAAKRVAKMFFSDTVSVVIGESGKIKRKPAPDMVEKALDELFSTREEAVYVGDSEVDIETAKNAGMDVISVTWGFRSERELKDVGAQMFANAPRDILKLV